MMSLSDTCVYQLVLESQLCHKIVNLISELVIAYDKLFEVVIVNKNCHFYIIIGNSKQ